MNDRFQIVGARPLPEAAPTKNRHSLRGKPVASAMILSLIALGCAFFLFMEFTAHSGCA